MTASLREKLRAKTRRSLIYSIAIADTAETEQAAEQARAEHRLALFRGGEDSDEAKKAKKALDKAEKTEAACYEQVTIQALPAADFEALADAHPRRDGDPDDAMWHVDTFRPALLAACADSDMTEEDWTRFFKESASYGDSLGLLNAALDVNTRAPSPTVPKGSTPIRS
ncbi:MAG: hypothetical protein ACRDMV_18075 [Streptosporangiales bacterium]